MKPSRDSKYIKAARICHLMFQKNKNVSANIGLPWMRFILNYRLSKEGLGRKEGVYSNRSFKAFKLRCTKI